MLLADAFLNEKINQTKNFTGSLSLARELFGVLRQKHFYHRMKKWNELTHTKNVKHVLSNRAEFLFEYDSIGNAIYNVSVFFFFSFLNSQQQCK